MSSAVTLASESSRGWWGRRGRPSGPSREPPCLSHTRTHRTHTRAHIYTKAHLCIISCTHYAHTRWLTQTGLNNNFKTVKANCTQTALLKHHALVLSDTQKVDPPASVEGTSGWPCVCRQTAPDDSARPAARWQCQARWHQKEEGGDGGFWEQSGGLQGKACAT